MRTLKADTSKAKYLCKIHMAAGVMPSDSLKKTDVFYTLTGKSAEVDTSKGVRREAPSTRNVRKIRLKEKTKETLTKGLVSLSVL